jgi:hypothetical protein
VGKWIVTKIMQQPSEPIHLDFVIIKLFGAVLVDASKHSTRDMTRTKAVRKSRILCTGIYKIREPKLTDVVQSLENGG